MSTGPTPSPSDVCGYCGKRRDGHFPDGSNPNGYCHPNRDGNFKFLDGRNPHAHVPDVAVCLNCRRTKALHKAGESCGEAVLFCWDARDPSMVFKPEPVEPDGPHGKHGLVRAVWSRKADETPVTRQDLADLLCGLEKAVGGLAHAVKLVQDQVHSIRCQLLKPAQCDNRLPRRHHPVHRVSCRLGRP